MEHETEPGEAQRPDAGSQAGQDIAAGPAGAGPDTGSASDSGTGEPRVDAALRLLDRLPGLPVAEHSELFEQVHAQLTEVLGELDPGAGGPASPRAD